MMEVRAQEVTQTPSRRNTWGTDTHMRKKQQRRVNSEQRVQIEGRSDANTRRKVLKSAQNVTHYLGRSGATCVGWGWKIVPRP